MHSLASLLLAELERRDWSIRKLAEEAGLSQPTVSKLITISNRTPDLETLVRLSGALDLPLRQLIEACGFKIEEVPDDASDQRARAIIGAIPELQAFLDPIVELSPDDRMAVLVYIESLHRRRKTG